MVIDTLRAFARGGATVVVATHDPWIRSRCDTTVALDSPAVLSGSDSRTL